MAQLEYECEKCGATIRYWPSERTLYCRDCGAEQHWAPEEPSQTIDAEPPAAVAREQSERRDRLVPIPENLHFESDGATLRIRRRWFTPMVFGLVFFCIAWDSFLVFWYSMAFGGDAPWIMIVFPIGHLAVGVGLTYYCIAMLFNTTTIRVDRNQLAVSLGPIPWRGNRQVSAREVRQLYCCESSNRWANQGSGARVVTFDICAVLHTRQKLTFVTGVTCLEEALAIEQAIEAHLDLPDEPVAGEVAL